MGTLVIASLVFATAPTVAAVALPAGTPRMTSNAQVTIAHMRFRPRIVNVNVGATVTWVSQANGSHTSTSDAGLWNSGPIPPGGTFSVTFDTAGTFAYHCKYAKGMTGQITVQPAP
jgi:plastocyanin